MKDDKGLSEEEFLSLYKTKNYEKPSVTADIICIKTEKDKHYILLIKRKNHPYIEKWALPGGFSNKNEAVEETAKREFFEETSLKMENPHLIGIYSKPGRDPRGWVISACYLFILDDGQVPIANDDASLAAWFEIKTENNKTMLENKALNIRLELSDKNLAFDHKTMISDALNINSLPILDIILSKDP